MAKKVEQLINYIRECKEKIRIEEKNIEAQIEEDLYRLYKIDKIDKSSIEGTRTLLKNISLISLSKKKDIISDLSSKIYNLDNEFIETLI